MIYQSVFLQRITIFRFFFQFVVQCYTMSDDISLPSRYNLDRLVYIFIFFAVVYTKSLLGQKLRGGKNLSNPLPILRLKIQIEKNSSGSH